MDPFVPIALTFGMLVAASQQAAVMEQYAARARQSQAAAMQPAWEAPPLVYAAPPPAPVPGWAAGAAVGSQVGALVSASNPVLHCGRRGCSPGFDPRPVLAGAVIGGLVGQAASYPPPVIVAQAPAAEPARHGDSAATRAFQDHWQNFMQPSGSGLARPRPAPVPGWER